MPSGHPRAAVITREKVGVVAKKVQADASAASTSLQCAAEAPEHLESLLGTPGIKDAAEAGLRALGERADRYFFSDLYRRARFLHPAADNVALALEGRESSVQLLVK